MGLTAEGGIPDLFDRVTFVAAHAHTSVFDLMARPIVEFVLWEDSIDRLLGLRK